MTDKAKKQIGTGHIFDRGKPAKLEDNLPEGKPVSFCPFDSFCTVRPLLKKEHCSKDYVKTCQTARFYEKYGKDYDQLGVGS